MLHATVPAPSPRAMRLTLARAISAAAVSALLLSGCGSTESVSTSDTTVATEDASTGADSTAAAGLSSETTVSSEGAASETTVAAAAPAGGVVLSDGQAPAERQIVLSAEGFSPATLTIKSGDKVTFTTADGIYGVIVGTLDGATVTKGLVETFAFSAPGTYPVREDLSGATATIIVE
jgi:plastocyanin